MIITLVAIILSFVQIAIVDFLVIHLTFAFRSIQQTHYGTILELHAKSFQLMVRFSVKPAQARLKSFKPLSL